MASWTHSMHGVPWTPSKMRRAVAILREGASVSFAFGAEPLDRLAVLDDKVLRARPDLVLHVWSTAESRRLDDTQVEALASLRHLRHLQVTGVKRADFAALARQRALESLQLTYDGALDLAFLAPMSRLRHVNLHAKLDDLDPLPRLKRLESLELAGSLPDLAPLARCTRLSALRLGPSTIRSLDFLAALARLRVLAIDCATIAGSLDGIGRARALVDLSLTSNKHLRDVAFLARARRLERLRLDQPAVVKLPGLGQLAKLATIELGNMKAWTNPEVLETLPRVRTIALTEINPKLGAERFFFLADGKRMRALEEVDLRFIDFGKRRRAALEAHFAAAGRAALLTPE